MGAAPNQRHVILVTGPPCSGKTTWAHHRAQPGDLVVDADTIARRLGSPDPWLPTQPWRDTAQAVMWQQMALVAAMTTGTAYIIRSAPDPAERTRLATWLRAEQVVVLLPPAPVLLSRARTRPRPYRTIQAIRHWHTRYRPAPGDHLNPD